MSCVAVSSDERKGLLYKALRLVEFHRGAVENIPVQT